MRRTELFSRERMVAGPFPMVYQDSPHQAEQQTFQLTYLENTQSAGLSGIYFVTPGPGLHMSQLPVGPVLSRATAPT